MRNILDKFRGAYLRFMSGRYGADQLNMALLITALTLSVIGALTHWTILSLLSNVLVIVALWRMLSKNRYKRASENAAYMQRTLQARKMATEWQNRFKNRKQFRYFVCPKCKMRLRVPRGVGRITITCKSCGEKFDKTA